MAEIGVGIVGLGFGERVHVPGFARVEGARIVATCARHRSDATYRDWRDLVADRAVEIVSIATPPVTHFAIAQTALAARKAVLCEKPLAVTAGEARELARAAEGLPTLVGFEFRTVPAFERAHELLASGAIGRPRAAQVVWRVGGPAGAPPAPSWKDRAEEGGGALLNFGIHVFDYLPWLIGPAEPKSGRAEQQRQATQGETADDWLEAELEHANGARSSILVSTRDAQPSGHRIEITGERGRLVLDNRRLDDHMAAFTLTLNGHPEPFPPPPAEDGRIAPFARLASRLVRAVDEGVPCEPSFAHGADAQTLASAVRL